MPSSISRPVSGFTLVELSIVLVVIGLLLGGVIIGKDMIRSAQLRSVITDMQGYLAASMMFQDKYNCIPGDCTNATTFFSGAANGNGDGLLKEPSVAGGKGEMYGFWQQLAAAGYIKGTYTGNSGAGSPWEQTVGVNVPGSRVPAAGWEIYGFGTVNPNSTLYNGNYQNNLYFGSKYQGLYDMCAAILTPAEAYAIDLKSDDGIPGTGSIRTRIGNAYAPNCNTSGSVYTSPSTSAYNITYSGIACPLIFDTGW